MLTRRSFTVGSLAVAGLSAVPGCAQVVTKAAPKVVPIARVLGLQFLVNVAVDGGQWAAKAGYELFAGRPDEKPVAETYRRTGDVMQSDRSAAAVFTALPADDPDGIPLVVFSNGAGVKIDLVPRAAQAVAHTFTDLVKAGKETRKRSEAEAREFLLPTSAGSAYTSDEHLNPTLKFDTVRGPVTLTFERDRLREVVTIHALGLDWIYDVHGTEKNSFWLKDEVEKIPHD